MIWVKPIISPIRNSSVLTLPSFEANVQKGDHFYPYNKSMLKRKRKPDNTGEVGKICKQLLQYYGISYIVLKVS